MESKKKNFLFLVLSPVSLLYCLSHYVIFPNSIFIQIYSLPSQTTVSLHKPQQPKSSSPLMMRTTTHHSLPKACTALSSQQTMEKRSDVTLYSVCLPRIKTLAAMQKSVITSEMGTQGPSLTWHQQRASYQQINLLRLGRHLSSRWVMHTVKAFQFETH